MVEAGGGRMRISTSNLQNNFGKYLRQAIAGRDITITKNDRDVARLVGIEDNKVKEAAEIYTSDYVTYEEFLKLDDGNRYEYIDGQVYMLSAPRGDHQYVSFVLSVEFAKYFEDKSCQPFSAPFDVTFITDENTHVVQPDISVICDLEKFDKEYNYLGTPALVVEILSSNTAKKDLYDKAKLYDLAGVKEYWIIDIKKKQAILYNYEEEVSMSVYKYGEIIVSTYFEGLEVNSRLLFDLPI
ncbi:MAG: type II toxin-antitoxin system Phd/YefM family antitoxin [Clostridiales bacterium]|nr:type II toxin-antitoxin system Phd/YefM family antitoxin [Clostridiales bacterium]